MTTLTHQTSERFCQYWYEHTALGISIDISRMSFPDDFFQKNQALAKKALNAMKSLEAGAIANPDEQRQVGHYWLRTPEKAPEDEITAAIEKSQRDFFAFAYQLLSKEYIGPAIKPYTHLLLIGIGGSALGNQLLHSAFPQKHGLIPHFLDNTDPDGIQRTLLQLEEVLETTLCIVISKSGGTKETHNGLKETQAFFAQQGLHFPHQAIAITAEGSQLHQQAATEGWCGAFPMWDWVGGRTSISSVVGLLPGTLMGLDMEAFLWGAAKMDEATLTEEPRDNPAMLLALMWWHAAQNQQRQMVILPYRDCLDHISHYLQQLIMESLGKGTTLDGSPTEEGFVVYGNKGSTDQHAFIQQLHEGLSSHFVTFLQVLKDESPSSVKVESNRTSGDYLQGFLLGTRQALSLNQRDSILIQLQEFEVWQLGALIALFERAVGFYAQFANINAYHQPGVELGKTSADAVLKRQEQLLELLVEGPHSANTAATKLGCPEEAETLFHLLEHLHANERVEKNKGTSPLEHLYQWRPCD